MLEVRAQLRPTEFSDVESLIFESEGMESWNLYENFDDKGYWLQGVFESESDAISGKQRFESLISIESSLVISELEDKDWKESYKEHFKPWSIGNLHWAPIWLKEEYSIGEDEEAVWLDPGMAFGTGNHGTTRLCVEALMEFNASGNDVDEARLVDAGCGSGILAISAAKLGFRHIEGFDVDGDAVRIAEENATLNEISNIRFSTCGLVEGLGKGSIDCLLANILANVLVSNFRLLIDSVAPGGWLILSGILREEVDDVASHFRSEGDWESERINQLDEWASIRLVKRLR